jgi:hypothetical protein
MTSVARACQPRSEALKQPLRLVALQKCRCTYVLGKWLKWTRVNVSGPLSPSRCNRLADSPQRPTRYLVE